MGLTQLHRHTHTHIPATTNTQQPEATKGTKVSPRRVMGPPEQCGAWWHPPIPKWERWGYRPVVVVVVVVVVTVVVMVMLMKVVVSSCRARRWGSPMTMACASSSAPLKGHPARAAYGDLWGITTTTITTTTTAATTTTTTTTTTTHHYTHTPPHTHPHTHTHTPTHPTQTHWHTGTPTHRHTDSPTHRHTGTQTQRDMET